jgi:hypothetical protein
LQQSSVGDAAKKFLISELYLLTFIKTLTQNTKTEILNGCESTNRATDLDQPN